MKYIVLPILKIVWAIIMTVVSTGLYTIASIAIVIHIIWNLKCNKEFLKDTIEYEFFYIESLSVLFSPYFNPPENYTRYKFKTLYHYIWNIDYQIIKE